MFTLVSLPLLVYLWTRFELDKINMVINTCSNGPLEIPGQQTERVPWLLSSLLAYVVLSWPRMVNLSHSSIYWGDERWVCMHYVSCLPALLHFCGCSLFFLPRHVSRVYLGSTNRTFYWLRDQPRQPPRLFIIKLFFDLEHIKYTIISTVFQQVVFEKLSLSFWVSNLVTKSASLTCKEHRTA